MTERDKPRADDKATDKATDKAPDALHWSTSARDAHTRDERNQSADIERKSDKGPDEAEAHMTDKEREAHRMRTRNET